MSSNQPINQNAQTSPTIPTAPTPPIAPIPPTSPTIPTAPTAPTALTPPLSPSASASPNGATSGRLSANAAERDYSASVSEIQTRLRNVQSNNTSRPLLITNGVYGPETTRAVRDFQRQFSSRFSLDQTGVVDKKTWDAITTISDEAYSYFSDPLSMSPYPLFDLTLQRYDTGVLVTIIQSMFNSLSLKYRNYALSSVFGIFDEKLRSNVIALQRSTNLPQTGIINKKTWNSLAKIFDSLNSEFKIGKNMRQQG